MGSRNNCFKMEEITAYLRIDGNSLTEMEKLMMQREERVAGVTSLSGERRWDRSCPGETLFKLQGTEPTHTSLCRKKGGKEINGRIEKSLTTPRAVRYHRQQK